jgi:PAS domain-containing serine/threonine kinase
MISEDNCKKIITQIALAVNYMKEQGIVHRDLKDENVVIDENYNLKIIDLGCASQIPQAKEHYFTSFQGTKKFSSPEELEDSAHRGTEAEIW